MTNPNLQSRPYQVTFLGWLFIVVGIVSTAVHLWKATLDRWVPLIILVGALAVVAGAYLLRGANWARWLTLAWLAFHVVVSALNSVADALLGAPRRHQLRPSRPRNVRVFSATAAAMTRFQGMARIRIPTRSVGRGSLRLLHKSTQRGGAGAPWFVV